MHPLFEHFIKCQRHIILLSDKGSAEVCAIVATTDILSSKLYDCLDRGDLVADLCINNAEFRNIPRAEITFPKESFLPPEIDAEPEVVRYFLLLSPTVILFSGVLNPVRYSEFFIVQVKLSIAVTTGKECSLCQKMVLR